MTHRVKKREFKSLFSAQYFQRAALLAIIALVCVCASARASVVCREPGGITGYEDVEARAALFVPNRSPGSTPTVYVTKKGDSYYFHSNYMTPGHSVATKIATESRIDLETAAMNIAYDVRPDAFARLPEFNFVIDRSLFRDPEVADFLRSAPFGSTLSVTEGEAGTRLLREVSLRESTEWVEELATNLFLRPHAEEGGTATSSLPFSRDNLRVAALVENSATLQGMADLLPVANRLTVAAADDVTSIFNGQKGRLVMLVGHVENGAIVRRDHAGAVLKTYDFAALRSAAADAGANLFILGCHSADFLTSGVASTFNTLDAIQRISQAVNAPTALEFWSSLASPEMPLIVQREMVERAVDGSAQSQVEGVIVDAREGVEVGTTFASYTQPPPPPPEPPAPAPYGGVSCWTVFLVAVGVQLALISIIFLARRLRG